MLTWLKYVILPMLVVIVGSFAFDVLALTGDSDHIGAYIFIVLLTPIVLIVALVLTSGRTYVGVEGQAVLVELTGLGARLFAYKLLDAYPEDLYQEQLGMYEHTMPHRYPIVYNNSIGMVTYRIRNAGADPQVSKALKKMVKSMA